MSYQRDYGNKDRFFQYTCKGSRSFTKRDSNRTLTMSNGLVFHSHHLKDNKKHMQTLLIQRLNS